jgi:hypothetical protein
MNRLARVIVAIALLFFKADPLPADESYVALVPWRVLDVDTKVDAPLVLYWIPASVDELRRSELLTSDELTLFSSQCVAMRVVRLNDQARVLRLAADAELPLAVLVDHSGEAIGRVESEHGVLSVAKIEELVHIELARRESESEATLDRARKQAEENDVDGAVALYRAVWEARCVCPRQGRDAKKALKKLGRR